MEMNALLDFDGTGQELWRQGSKVAKRWSKVKPGMTVEKAIAVGATLGDIRWAVEHKPLKLKRGRRASAKAGAAQVAAKRGRKKRKAT